MARHKDPTKCAVGAMAFYLFYRFHVTGEFDSGSGVDFLKNHTWFDIKLLTEIRSKDRSQSILNTTYSNAIKAACKAANVPSCHLVHIGRVLGSCESELDEDCSEDLRHLGK